ncbi:WD40 repeat domain-containing protein [Hyphococcus sp.]|uniref:WD40 repeat domain-containing protein n=1 Tax=Hyphococcus sp. TaxID=2038636 RepID=UPI003CCC4148
MTNLTSRIAIAMIASSIAFGPSIAAANPDEAVQTYREFLEARENAESIQDLYPYMLSRQVEQLQGLPEETLETMGESVLNPPNAEQLRMPKGDFELVSSTRDGDQITLILKAKSEEDGIRESLRRRVRLIKEEDGWKVRNPNPASWRVTGRMPTDMGDADAPKKPGPAAKKWKTKFSGDAGGLELVAEAVITEHNSAVDDFIRWDPQGNFIAVGDGDGTTYLSIPDLKALWVSKARNGGGAAVTISADSQWQAVTPNNSPAFTPLSYSLENTPPSDDYFFFEPAYAAVAEAAGRVNVRSVQFHPSEPVIAVVNQGSEGHAIIFQPVQRVVKDDANTEALEQWPIDVEPTRFAWSPAGDQIAFVRGYTQLGSEIEIRTYPDNEKLTTLSSEAFGPGALHFSPDGEHLFVTGGDNEGLRSQVWDIGSENIAGDFAGVRFGAWAPDNEHLFAVKSGGMSVEAGLDDVIHVLMPGGDEPVSSMTAFPQGDGKYPSQIRAVSVSPNGRYLAATASTNSSEGEKRLTVKLWEIAGK